MQVQDKAEIHNNGMILAKVGWRKAQSFSGQRNETMKIIWLFEQVSASVMIHDRESNE